MGSPSLFWGQTLIKIWLEAVCGISKKACCRICLFSVLGTPRVPNQVLGNLVHFIWGSRTSNEVCAASLGSKLKSTRIFFYYFDDVETKSQNAFFYAEVLRALSVPKCTREHLFHSIILIEDSMYIVSTYLDCTNGCSTYNLFKIEHASPYTVSYTHLTLPTILLV